MARRLTPETATEATMAPPVEGEKRKRGRPRKAPEAQPNGHAEPAAFEATSTTGGETTVITSNVTDDTLNEFCDRLEAEHDKLTKIIAEGSAQRAVIAGVYSRAKKAGIPKDTLKEYLDERKMDPADLTRAFAWKNRILALRKIPVGTQLGFLPGQTNIATAVDEGAIREAAGKLRTESYPPSDTLTVSGGTASASITVAENVEGVSVLPANPPAELPQPAFGGGEDEL